MSEIIKQTKKRVIMISINDYCNLPFEMSDLKYWRGELSKMLADYDVEITNVIVQDVVSNEANQA